MKLYFFVAVFMFMLIPLASAQVCGPACIDATKYVWTVSISIQSIDCDMVCSQECNDVPTAAVYYVNN